jgi:hypothetical protein
MHPRRLAGLLALTPVVALAAGGCSGAESDEPAGPAATFSANDAGCDIATNGYTYEPGPIDVRFTNDHTEPVSIEVLAEDGTAVATAEDLAPGDTLDQEADFAAGDHTVRCTDGALTWDSTGGGVTPSGNKTSSQPYVVGS